MNEFIYGKLDSEKVAEENELCRKVVKEISNFGISERQKLLIIYLLALELENSEQLQNITDTIKDCAKDNLFLSAKLESEV